MPLLISDANILIDADIGGLLLPMFSMYGLHAAVWTADLSKAVQTARALRAVAVHVNQHDGET